MTHKLIEYIHIPKCGGTFIKNLLETFSEQPNDSQLTCKAYRKKFGDCADLHLPFFKIQNNSKFFIAVVRDPFTRLLSNYFYDLENWKILFGHENCSSFDTFVNFLFLNPQMIFKHIHLYPQVYFLLDKNIISSDIHIMSFKDLPFNVFYLLKSLNLPVRNYNLLKNFNKQENLDYTPALKGENYERIKFIYSDDIRLLSQYF
jgi:hypothetical protein